MSLSILSGGVEVKNIAIADDPAFSKTPFVTAKSLKVGVELMPLIFSKQLNVTGITLEQPEITLLKAANGTWNFSSLGEEAAKKAAESKSNAAAPTNFSVAKLEISNGKLMVGKANSSKKSQVYDKVNITVSNFSLTSQFPFELTAQLPGGGDAKISGKAGPIPAADAAKTPFDAAVKVNNMDIAASGFIDPASGIAGLANFDGTLNSNGSQAKAVGTFTGNKLKFSPKGTPAPKAVVVKHAVDVDLDKQSGAVTQGDVEIGKAVAHLTGTFRTEGETQVLNMKLNAPNMPVDELQVMLPVFGHRASVGITTERRHAVSGAGNHGAGGQVGDHGPGAFGRHQADRVRSGLETGGAGDLCREVGLQPDTSVQNVSLNARVAPEGTKADNINLNVPAIGVITGAGTVSPGGELNFKMLADLHGGMVGGVSQMAAMGSGKSGIPFAVGGTMSNPKFIPDVKGMVGGALQGVLSGKTPIKGVDMNALGGLFGKKKPPK